MLKRIFHLVLAGLCPLAMAACEEELPTAEDGDLLPVSARTVEIQLPFESFVQESRTLFGFGSPSQLGQGLLARDFEGVEARTLIRFAPPPPLINVRDTTGASVGDSVLTFVGGRAIIRFDTLQLPSEPVTLTGGALGTAWDARSASWQLAIDTVGSQAPWPEGGGGPVQLLDTLVWDPAQGDSVVLEVDSAVVNVWADTTIESRGLRLAAETPGTLLRVRNAVLRLDTRPSVNPDTVVPTSVGLSDLTFIYDPLPAEPPEGELRVGGAPAWRTVLHLDLPEAIEPGDPACAQLECPFSLSPESVILAALVLESRPSPIAFRPSDSLAVEPRPVLAPERLPKSPLGSRISMGSGLISPEAFGEAGAQAVSIPLTSYVRDLIRGETESGNPVFPALALVSSPEPRSFAIATFAGAGSGGAPFIRIILTLADGVSLP